MTTSQTKGCFLSVMHLHCWRIIVYLFSMARRDAAADIKGKRPFSYTDAKPISINFNLMPGLTQHFRNPSDMSYSLMSQRL